MFRVGINTIESYIICSPVNYLTKSFTEEAEQLYNYFYSEAPFLTAITANDVNNKEKKNISWKKSEIFLGWRKKCWFDYRNSTIDFALNAQEQWI